MKLNIKQSNWSGWSKDYKTTESEQQFDIALNKKYVVKAIKVSHIKDGNLVEKEKEIFSFQIVEINDSNIKIQTFQPFSSHEGNTINLKKHQKEFIVSDEKELKLVTPTMDYGDTFILTLIK